MNELTIHLDGDKRRYTPGSEVTGEVVWEVWDAEQMETLHIRCLWEWRRHEDNRTYTYVVEEMTVPNPGTRGRHGFAFRLPGAPWSFVGQLQAITWHVEAVLQPGDHTCRQVFEMAPEDFPLHLHQSP